jgi:putative hydrolase of the HAD superfamily
MAESIRAVIFDLDDTLVDHVGSVRRALQTWLPTAGNSAPRELLDAWLGASERHYPGWESGQITFAEQRRRRLRDFLPLLGITPGDDESLDRAFADYLRCYQASWTTFADVDGVLIALAEANLMTAVLSNGTAVQQNAKIAAVGLRGRVGPVFTAEELGVAKPDPSAYLTVCAALGVPPGSVLHVGDRYDLDVVAPRAAGLQALYLDRADRGPRDEPHRVTSLHQLRPCLARG